MHIKFWVGYLKGRDHSKDIGVYGKGGKIRMDLREIGWEGMDQIHLLLDMDWWWALVDMKMNLQFP